MQLNWFIKYLNQKMKYVEGNEEVGFQFTGNLNISILEAMVGLIIENLDSINELEKIKFRYKKVMSDTIRKAIEGIESNPFSVSTGTIQAIELRFEICKKILW